MRKLILPVPLLHLSSFTFRVFKINPFRKFLLGKMPNRVKNSITCHTYVTNLMPLFCVEI
jgi:hypothetical protein